MLDFHTLASTIAFTPTTNVVVVGGTQGIGAGIALRAAQLGASVLIMGRNSQRGAEMVVTMREASPSSMSNSSSDTEHARFEFVRADLGSVEAMAAAVDAIAAWAGTAGVQYLYQSQGGALTGILGPSLSEVKAAFNAHVLSHFVIQERLHARGVLAVGAQSCHIGNPRLAVGKVELGDVRMLEGQEGAGVFSGRLKAVMGWMVLFNFMIKEFNRRYPETHTTDLLPCVVPTPSTVHPSLPLLFRLFSRFLNFCLYIVSSMPILSSIPFLQFGLSPIQYADVVLYETAHRDAVALKREFWDSNGKELKVGAYFEDVTVGEGVWDALTKLSEDRD